jgi:hypothetical protein
MLVLGGEKIPCVLPHNYYPEAVWFADALGNITERAIVMIQGWEWRKVTQRFEFGAPGFATMQLLPQANSR